MASKPKMTLLVRFIPVPWKLDDNGDPVPLKIPAETDPQWNVLQGCLKGYTVVFHRDDCYNHKLTDTELAMLANGQRVTFFDLAIIEDIKIGRNNTQNEPLLDLIEVTKFEHREMTCTFDTMIDPCLGSIIQPRWNSEYGQFHMPSKELERLIKEDLIASTIHGIWDLETKFGKRSIILREKLD